MFNICDYSESRAVGVHKGILSFFISRTIVIHVGLRKHGIRELTLYLLLCLFIGTQYTHFSFFYTETTVGYFRLNK